ncbi:MAG TPA: hypothetical protein VNW92_03750, partial [Polyangiaceae bacterium]|nr:hypothetical protein [Polyangiaceae bacterium]
MARAAGVEDGVDLEWSAPDECPSAEYVRADVERLLGRSVDFTREGQVRVQGVVRPSPTGTWTLLLRVEVKDRVEVDTLVANRCQALADAMALKAALALDPLAVAETMAPAPTVAPPPTVASPRRSAAPTAANTAQKPAVAARSSSHSPRFELRIGGVGSRGYLPGFSEGGALYAALHLSALRFELGGQAESGGDARDAREPAVGVHLALFFAAARSCVIGGEQRWTFPICAGVELGTMRGVGFGVPTAATAGSLWSAVVVGPSVRFALSHHWAAWLEIDAVFDFVRPGFQMQNLG